MTEGTHILDETMLEELFRKHFSELSLYALRYVNDVDTSREIVHNVFIALWDKREQVDTSRPMKPFLFTAVRNRCLNHLRDSRYHDDLENLAEEIPEIPEEEEPSEILQVQLYRAINELPQRSREIFEMNRFESLTYREIAERLGISQKTVETLMSRTLKTLREKLKNLLTLVPWIGLFFYLYM
jgi:RNA polymerase sigma-70 factor (ECF subfamily)